MSKWSETRIANALNNPVSPRRVRRLTLRTALALALLATLLCGAAVAAVSWGTRNLIHIPDKKNGSAPNARLDPYIQPIGKTFACEALRVEVIDALYDGRALALAWTVENKLDQPLYLICEDLRANGGRLGQGAMRGVDELFIQPGEVIRSGFVQEIVDVDRMESCQVRIQYAALLPTGEVVKIDSQKEDEEVADYIAHIDALVAEGKVVVAPDGVIELGSAGRRRDDETAARQLVREGVMTYAGALEVEFTLPRTGDMRSGLREGQPVEAVFDGYTLRVTTCAITPLVVHIQMECRFESADALTRFQPYYEGKHGPLWSFAALANGESRWYNNMGSGFVGEPEEQPDGSWIWKYEFQAMEPHLIPDEITIMAQRDVGDAHDVPFPEESLTLTMGE